MPGLSIGLWLNTSLVSGRKRKQYCLKSWSDFRCAENERLPTELGWTKKANPISLDEITRMSQLITNATSLLTGSDDSKVLKVRDLHSGFIPDGEH